jgi:hypothetical protein
LDHLLEILLGKGGFPAGYGPAETSIVAGAEAAKAVRVSVSPELSDVPPSRLIRPMGLEEMEVGEERRSFEMPEPIIEACQNTVCSSGRRIVDFETAAESGILAELNVVEKSGTPSAGGREGFGQCGRFG